MAGPTEQDLSVWQAAGGARDGAAFVTPDGTKLKSWAAAAKWLKAGAAGEKRKSGGGAPAGKPAKKAKEDEAEDDGDDAMDVERDVGAKVGSGRAAAQGRKYADAGEGRLSADDRVTVVDFEAAESEPQAVDQTWNGVLGEAKPKGKQTRRLFDFAVFDEDGRPQPLDSAGNGDFALFFSGVVQPESGAATKQTGRRIAKAGPISDWSFSAATEDETCVTVTTATATYVCEKPSTAYKKIFVPTQERATLAHDVMRSLDPNASAEATPQASLNEVCARLARLRGSALRTTRDLAVRSAAFLLGHLEKADAAAAKTAAKSKGKGKGESVSTFVDLPFAKDLRDAYAEWAGQPLGVHTTGITIKESGSGGGAAAGADGKSSTSLAQMSADEAMARAMYEEERMKEEKKQQKLVERAAKAAAGKEAYIKISPTELADEYPEPQAYEKEEGEDEMDELLMDELDDVGYINPEYLPRRLLSHFAIYDSEGLLSSLELLPMWSGVDPDTELYASGVVTDDDGEWGHGAVSAIAAPEPAGGSGAGGSGSGGSGSGGSSAGGSSAGGSGGGGSGAGADAPQGLRIYLSQIKEWVVEFGCDMLMISMRTDSAWYRLMQPTPEYKPWYEPVLKSARVAVKCISMLLEETRAARVTFDHVVKRLAAQAEGESTFISAKERVVERYVLVHAQIILNQFRSYPVNTVKQSQFVTTLRERMLVLRHTRLNVIKKKTIQRSLANLNPVRSLAARKKPMRATTTTLVGRVWSSVISSAEAAAAAEQKQEAEDNVDADDAVDEDHEETEAPLAKVTSPRKKAPKRKQAAAGSIAWVGAPLPKKANGLPCYGAVKLGAEEVAVGGGVMLPPDEDDESGSPRLGLVMRLWEEDGTKFVLARLMAFGSDTVLGDVGSADEVFATEEGVTCRVQELQGAATLTRVERSWGYQHRAAAEAEDDKRRERAKQREADGLPTEFFWRRMWHPERGAFLDAPEDISAEAWEAMVADKKDKATLRCVTEGGKKGFHKQGVVYLPGDHMYIAPAAVAELGEEDVKPKAAKKPAKRKAKYEDEDEEDDEAEEDEDEEMEDAEDGDDYVPKRKAGAAKAAAPAASKKKAAGKKAALNDAMKTDEYAYLKGRNQKGVAQKVRAFIVGELLEVKTAKNGKPSELVLRRFVRPEEVSQEYAYESRMWELYHSDIKIVVPVGSVIGPCAVAPTTFEETDNLFTCDKAYDADNHDVKALPAGAVPAPREAKLPGAAAAAAAAKGKGKAAAGPPAAPEMLKTMDIFAGCGGLSEGLQSAGAAQANWAIEYEPDAAEAFRINHPHAVVFNSNCNVILRAAMKKAGLPVEQLHSAPDCDEQVKDMPEKIYNDIPLPGEVEFINGGPPCQGYSGMNRFTLKGSLWSKVQNEMILAFLSYADLYRPRYFLLENVRNFVAFNKSLTFRLAVRSLIEIGYQVRFGVLNAANFGVGQSRKRAFLIAAAPGEVMPDWPEPMTCFHSPQLAFTLPGGYKFCAVPQREGAPLRGVTVRDVIGELPPVPNGHERASMKYSKGPQSAFQRGIRNGAAELTDHVCKTLNELNHRRCELIPPGSNHDWRYLRHLVETGAIDAEYKAPGMSKAGTIVPWCLPNSEARHNGWRGLYSRLDWSGHFPTSTTDPNPMGKVGQVFHPEQTRIVSVRECARAQGFPDTFRFYGNVGSKHRQVGNAVPPPLARALGKQFKKALAEHASKQA